MYGPISISVPLAMGADSPLSSCWSATEIGSDVLEFVTVATPPGKLIVACNLDTRRCLSGSAIELLSSRPIVPPFESNARANACGGATASTDTTLRVRPVIVGLVSHAAGLRLVLSGQARSDGRGRIVAPTPDARVPPATTQSWDRHGMPFQTTADTPSWHPMSIAKTPAPSTHQATAPDQASRPK